MIKLKVFSVYFSALFLCLCHPDAFSQTFVEAQSNQGSNILRNAGFESGRGAWTITAATFSNSSLEFVPPGKFSGRFSLSAYTGTLLEQSVSNCSKLAGKNLEASISVKTSSLNVQVCSLSGGTEVQCVSSSSLNSFIPVVLNLPAPSSGSCGIRVKTTASTTGDVFLDEAYLGPALNIGTVGQAEAVLQAERSTTQSVTTAAETLVTPTAESLDSLDAFSGGIYTVKKKGTYGLSVTIQLANATTTEQFFFRWRYNNTAYTPCFVLKLPSAASETVTVACSYQAEIGDTFRATIQSTADTAYDVTAARWSMSYIPSASEQAIRPTDAAWYVDANIAGANPSLGVAAVTAYTEITDAGLTLTPAAGSAPVGAMCSGTNPATAPSSSPTNCSVGSESVGFNVSVPRPGLYEVCGYFSYRMNGDQNEGAAPTFQWIETPTNAQTITTEGRTRSFAQFYNMAIASATGGISSAPFSSCALFNFSSSGSKALRLMYEQAVLGTPNASEILADEGATVGQRNIRITMKPWLAPTPAPLLVGSVTSNSQGLTQIESVRVNRAGTCTTDSQSSDWYTLSSGGTGSCTFTFKTGMFTGQIPSCVCTTRNDGVGCRVGITATTLTTLTQTNTTGAAVDAAVAVICHGTK